MPATQELETDLQHRIQPISLATSLHDLRRHVHQISHPASTTSDNSSMPSVSQVPPGSWASNSTSVRSASPASPASGSPAARLSGQSRSHLHSPRPPRQWAPPLPRSRPLSSNGLLLTATGTPSRHITLAARFASASRSPPTRTSGPTLVTVSMLPYLHCLYTMVTERASSHAEPFAARPFQHTTQAGTGSGTIDTEGMSKHLSHQSSHHGTRCSRNGHFKSQLELRDMNMRKMSAVNPDAAEQARNTGFIRRCLACVRAQGLLEHYCKAGSSNFEQIAAVPVLRVAEIEARDVHTPLREPPFHGVFACSNCLCLSLKFSPILSRSLFSHFGSSRCLPGPRLESCVSFGRTLHGPALLSRHLRLFVCEFDLLLAETDFRPLVTAGFSQTPQVATRKSSSTPTQDMGYGETEPAWW